MPFIRGERRTSRTTYWKMKTEARYKHGTVHDVKSSTGLKERAAPKQQHMHWCVGSRRRSSPFILCAADVTAGLTCIRHIVNQTPKTSHILQ